MDNSTIQIRQEAQILKVLMLLLSPSVQGQKTTLASACQTAGITTDTWGRWRREGKIDPYLDEVREMQRSAIHEELVLGSQSIISTMIKLAQGEAPKGVELSAAAMISAFKALEKYLNIDPLGAKTATEAEYLEKTVIERVYVHEITESAKFRYDGSNQNAPRFGRMRSVLDGPLSEDEGDPTEETTP